MMQIQYLNGLGVVATRKRQILSGMAYEKYFKSPLKTDPVLHKDGNTFDTIQFMEQIVRKTLEDTKAIAKVLKGERVQETLQNLFAFLYRHVQYRIDTPGVEQLRRPSRTWADRFEGVDCDCYSIFISSVLTNLGIPHAFRKTKYGGKSYFQHIYVVVPKRRLADLNSRVDYWVVDPVMDAFDTEKLYSDKHDQVVVGWNRAAKSMEGIPIHFLNGERYYSQEVKQYLSGLGNVKDVLFTDGKATYASTGELGFLKKLWDGVKKVAKPLVQIATPIVSNVIPGGSAIMQVANSLLKTGGETTTESGAPPLLPVDTQNAQVVQNPTASVSQTATEGKSSGIKLTDILELQRIVRQDMQKSADKAVDNTKVLESASRKLNGKINQESENIKKLKRAMQLLNTRYKETAESTSKMKEAATIQNQRVLQLKRNSDLNFSNLKKAVQLTNDKANSGTAVAMEAHTKVLQESNKKKSASWSTWLGPAIGFALTMI
ncbi:hypothetical protein [Algivirga pacifica]|uniref:Transglutaminase-like domain-containing protein n=1 Tax=Algivirga pacifica TaxID=1162670 RepID=A0ABP9DN60_9BACT